MMDKIFVYLFIYQLGKTIWLCSNFASFWLQPGVILFCVCLGLLQCLFVTVFVADAVIVVMKFSQKTDRASRIMPV